MPAHITRLSVRRTRHGLTVSFARVSQAVKLVVRVALPLHRVLMLSTKHGTIAFSGVRSTEAATVTVRGVSLDGRFGPTARKRLRAPKR